MQYDLSHILAMVPEGYTYTASGLPMVDHATASEPGDNMGLAFLDHISPGDRSGASIIIANPIPFRGGVTPSEHQAWVFTHNPKLVFAKICNEIFPPEYRDNDRFGFVRDDDGSLVSFPHYGGVIIGENVDIGKHVAIDRGYLGDTVIGDGTKVDNLVHIAHNVVIGKDTMIVAGTIIGGSVSIGNRCFIGIGAMIKNGVSIGDDATIGMGSVVLKDVPPGETWCGNPAKKLR